MLQTHPGSGVLPARAACTALAMMFFLFATLTFSGYPNGLPVGSPAWWTVVGLMLLDALLFATTGWGLGSSWRKPAYYFGVLILAANIALVILDEFGVIDLLVLVFLLATLATLVGARHQITEEPVREQ